MFFFNASSTKTHAELETFHLKSTLASTSALRYLIHILELLSIAHERIDSIQTNPSWANFAK